MTLLHDDPAPRYAFAIRSLVFSLWAVKFAIDPIQDLALLPAEAFAPPFPIQWLPRSLELLLLNPKLLWVLRIGGTVAAMLCLYPAAFRWFVPFVCIAATLQQCLVRGYGHVNHAEIPLLLAAYVYCLGAWTMRGERRPEPLTLSVILVSTYMLTGVFRIVVGGWDIHVSDAIVYWCAEFSLRVSSYNFDLGTWIAERPVLWLPLKASFIATTVVETIGPLAILSNRFRAFYVVFMLGFHVAVALTMNIVFWESVMLLVALLAVPWNGLWIVKEAARPPRLAA